MLKKSVLMVGLLGCISAAANANQKFVTAPTGPYESSEFKLKILHINDHHSHLLEEDAELTINGIETDVKMGGFPRVVKKIDELDTSSEHVLKLHAGDAITGTLFYTLFRGEADAALMNEVCFDAFAFGNHEFDDGDAGLREFLDDLYSTNNCPSITRAVAANIYPAVQTPLRPTDISNPRGFGRAFHSNVVRRFQVAESIEFGDKFQPQYQQNYDYVAVVGLDIANKTKNSSNPNDSTFFASERARAQRQIYSLNRRGVSKVVLLTHFQYENDIELAESLSGVDVIVGGDSHSLLGDFSEFGLNPVGPYPTEVTNRDGKKVCIVQAWQYSAVVGELDVIFDENGDVVSCNGTPHLLIGDEFEQFDTPVSTETKHQLIGYLSEIEQIDVVKPDADAQAVLDEYAAEVEILAQEVIGQAAEDLCLERIPGQGRSQICDVSETAEMGSDISNIVALAFKEQSKADIAIQNAGGVRIDIAQGDITVEDAYTLLPFSNTLFNLEMTGAEIVNVLEEALAFALSPDGSTGAYPYASGLRWDIDASQPMGNRFSNIQVKLDGEIEWSAIDLNRTYTVVTNSFVAGGRDGYITFGEVLADGRSEDTFLDYAQSFSDYVTRVGTVNKLPAEDYSTQRYTD